MHIFRRQFISIIHHIIGKQQTHVKMGIKLMFLLFLWKCMIFLCAWHNLQLNVDGFGSGLFQKLSIKFPLQFFYQYHMSETIKVVVRIRPMNQKEKDRGCESIMKSDEDNNQLSIIKPQEPDNIKNFAYDSVFSESSKQSTVYQKTAFDLVENVLTGYNGTIFAYGQTGCGKTHSMVGVIDDEQHQGIIPRSFGHILQVISENKHKEYLIRCSFIEIYNQEVRDLLGKDVKKSLDMKESPDKGVFVKDLSSNPAKTLQQLMDYMNTGNKNRSVGETAMNKDSSRSHLLFMLYLQSAEEDLGDEKKYVGSKLNLVDLAGSERINKTGAQGSRLQEAKNINLSLSALGNVISALVDAKSSHIPYRDSKLTRLLQDSLGGNTKTVMMANCSPADYNFDETVTTLRYASRAKFIKNKPIINEDPKQAMLKEYASQIQRLKSLLNNQGSGEVNFNSMPSTGKKQANQQLKRKQRELEQEREEKKKLMERIALLQGQQVHGAEVKIDPKIKQKIVKARESINTAVVAIVEKTQQVSKPVNNSLVSNAKEQVKYLKNKVKGLQNEVKDVDHQNFLDKEVILNDLRDLTKQNKLLQGILKILLAPKQLRKVKEVSENYYNEESEKYDLPKFYLKNKDLQLPKISHTEGSGQQQKIPASKPKGGKRRSINTSQFEQAERKIKQNNSVISLKGNESNVINKKNAMGKLTPLTGNVQNHSYVLNSMNGNKNGSEKALGAMDFQRKPNRKQLQPLANK